MYNMLSQVSKVWAEFTHAAAEVRGHLKHCDNQLAAVELPGVSLDARSQRYQVRKGFVNQQVCGKENYVALKIIVAHSPVGHNQKVATPTH